MQSESLNVLISPLDWGLGHATRCIPVINELINAGHKVTIAGSGRSLILLKKEFPSLQSIELKGFAPNLSFERNILIQLVRLVPRFLLGILSEHRQLKILLKRMHFDVVISDNRYGMWNPNVKSVFITHQIMIKAPKWFKITEYLLYLISCQFISRFDACWIPDYEASPGLSGDLSHKFPLAIHTEFLGPLSRFVQTQKKSEVDVGKYKIVAIVSGPEPQRSTFEEILTRQLADYDHPSLLIIGKPEEEKFISIKNNLTIYSHLETNEFKSVIKNASLVISRSGYSSVMDFHVLQLKALFVPTSGQTEQQYLAELHKANGTAFWRQQENLNLLIDINEAMKYQGFSCNTAETGLKVAVAGLKKK